MYSVFNIDHIIERLIEDRDADPMNDVQLSEIDIRCLCVICKDVFLSQPVLLDIDAPVYVCGDIHGQYSDLLRIFKKGGFPPKVKYLFLGDYVDRGKQSIETICLLFAYKIKYPDTFYLLRGNHECVGISRMYGFFDDCKKRYNIKIWRSFTDCFDCLPVAAIIGKKIFCCHGGLSPDLRNMSEIKQIARPTDIPEHGLLCDLLWADPDKYVHGWGENNVRGVSYTFGESVVKEFLDKYGFELFVRAHQVVEDGYEFFGKQKLVTIFSAPNYCEEFNNAGAFMHVDSELKCSFTILKPRLAKSSFKLP